MEVLEFVNVVRINKGFSPLESLPSPGKLRGDLGFDSIDLAELAVRIEDATGVDVYAAGVVHTVDEILARLRRRGHGE